MNQITLIVGILIIPIYIIWGIRDYKLIKKDRAYLIPSYRNTILFNIILVAALSIISEHTNFKTDFSTLLKGYELFNSEMVLGIVVTVAIAFLLLPIITAKFEIKLPQPADFEALLPKTNKEMLWFFIVVITVAIGEELIFREFYFELLNQHFGLTGDLLLLATAIIFGLVHCYQGIAGVIATFLLGLVLGKIFQTTESLIVPIILHFLIDIKFLWNLIIDRYYKQ